MKLESLQSCLNGLSSQDSGLGSSQEFPSLQLEKIVIPAHLTNTSGSATTTTSSCGNVSTSTITSRKRQYSESSLSEFEEYNNKKPKLELMKEVNNSSDKETIVSKKDNLTTTTTNNDDDSSVVKKSSVEQDNKDLCILCNTLPQNAIFLHGSIAHMCSCYKCGIRTWGINKKCPLCNCKARNVVKLFTGKV